jgi:hypothetical protein
MKKVLLCPRFLYTYMEDYIKNTLSEYTLFLYDNNTIFLEENIYYLSLRLIPFTLKSPELTDFPPIGIMVDYKCPLLPVNSKIGFLNTEHYTDPVTLQYVKTYLLSDMDIFDYSKDNCKIMGKGTHLPYKERAEETSKLQEFMKLPKRYHVCIVGNTSERRKAVVEKLREQGYKVRYLTNSFGDKRDRQIGMSHLLLNIHLHDEWKIYESIRCERWRFAGMKIVSETSFSPDPEGIITSKYEDLVDTVCAELSGCKIDEMYTATAEEDATS